MLTETRVQEFGLNNLSAADQSAHILFAVTEFLVLLSKFDDQAKSYEERAANIVKIVRHDLKGQGLSEHDTEATAQFWDSKKPGGQSLRELLINFLGKASFANQQKQDLIQKAKAISPENKALLWPIVAKIKMPEATQEIINDIFYDEAGHKVLKGMTTDQRHEISQSLNSTESPILKKTRKRFEESRQNDSYYSALAYNQNQDFVFKPSEVQELLSSGALMADTRNAIEKIYSPVPHKYNFTPLVASYRQGIVDLRNFHLTCSLPSLLDGAVGGLPHDVLYHVLTFVGPSQVGFVSVTDLLNQSDVKKLRSSNKKFAKAHALMASKQSIFVKKPSVSFASRWVEFKNIFSCMSPDQIFFMAISAYLVTLSILFEVPEMLVLPALIMLGLFLGTLFVNNFWGMKTMAESFVRHDFGFWANSIILALSAVAGFAAIYCNMAWLMALPALSLILVVIRPLLVAFVFPTDVKVISDVEPSMPAAALLFDMQVSLSETKEDSHNMTGNASVVAKA